MEVPCATTIQVGNLFSYCGEKEDQDTMINNNGYDESEPQIEEPAIVQNVAKNGMSCLESNVEEFKETTPKKNKYNIINLFDFYNPKPDDELSADMISLAYNADFGNLKLSMFNLTETSTERNMLFRSELKPLVSGTMYPDSCYRAVHYIKKNYDVEFTCIEPLITKTNEQWQHERPIVMVYYKAQQLNPIIKIHNKITKKTYQFEFGAWKKDAFIDSLEFVFKEGPKLRITT